jgi:hypothetical protein
MAKTAINQNNPLTKFMRQPKIYISLPSQGQYWPANALEIPENGQFPVYSMTAKDEILFKTPDALMNGQAVVDVIQSCVPNIKNAWACPSIDLDMLLIAIRIATYGDKMSITYNIPVINEESDYEVDLHRFIDHANSIQWVEQVPIDEDMIIFVKPLNYKHMSTISQRGFETSKIMQIANDDKLSENQKADMIRASFNALTDLTTDMMVGSIFKIKTIEGDVTETRFIKEFIENADRIVVDTIQKHINDLKVQNDIKPVVFTTTLEQQEAGAPETFEVPINFDNSNFFG